MRKFQNRLMWRLLLFMSWRFFAHILKDTQCHPVKIHIQFNHVLVCKCAKNQLSLWSLIGAIGRVDMERPICSRFTYPCGWVAAETDVAEFSTAVQLHGLQCSDSDLRQCNDSQRLPVHHRLHLSHRLLWWDINYSCCRLQVGLEGQNFSLLELVCCSDKPLYFPTVSRRNV